MGSHQQHHQPVSHVNTQPSPDCCIHSVKVELINIYINIFSERLYALLQLSLKSFGILFRFYVTRYSATLEIRNKV